jgi:hypothetical protein
LGNGNVTVTASANTGGVRTGTITIAGQSVTVNQSAPAQTGMLAFSSTASKGWSSIQVFVDGQNIGTLTAFVSPSTSSNCSPSSGRVVTTVAAGSHSFSASSNTGAHWSGTVTVTTSPCHEEQLTCPNNDCSASSSSVAYLPVPVLNCVSNASGKSTVTITNNSSYTLQFVFSGPLNTTFSVVSQGTSPTYSFSPGQYQESVSATNATNVQPSSGPVTVPTSATCTETWVNGS